ncbi:MAG TPA: cation:proton antiporter, partial [Nannocystaceae bacterium]|nr:cation:proton antiporter [Nannocystaceae bacterium]
SSVAPAFVEDLAVALGVAAVTMVICRRLGTSAVLGYLVAGLIVGPYLPVPLFAEPVRVEALSEFGVVLVMFGIGLEFSIGKLVRALPRVGALALVEVSAMMWFGFLLGRAFGFSTVGSVFLGACLAISSTMVVARAFAEQPIDDEQTELVFGVLVVQDLVAVVLVAVLTAVASGAGVEPDQLVMTLVRLGGFLAVMVVGGLLIVPRLVRAIGRLGHSETLLIAAVGLCFVLATVAARAGYSVALGAFLAGSLVAESGEHHRVEALVRPVRDLFAAVFFVSIGMLVDPELVLGAWPQTLLVTAVVLVGQFVVVTVAAFLAGNGLYRSVRAGLCLAQIGEFSFIIAGIGIAAGVVDASLLPITVGVAALTALTTPVLVKRSADIAAWLDARLPRRLQAVAGLYESWFASIRTSRSGAAHTRLRRAVRAMIVDGLVLATIVIIGELAHHELANALGRVGIEYGTAMIVVDVALALLCLPFVVGLVRCVRIFGSELAHAALPAAAEGEVDLGQAPRRVLTVGLQLAAVLLVGLPLLAVTAPFLPPWLGAPALAGGLGVLALLFWRTADNLQGHIRAGAEVVAELLRAGSGSANDLETQVRAMLPGMGEVTPFTIADDLPSCGKTLAELDLRGRTGATVLAIERQGGPRIAPTGAEPLQPGDVLAIAGSHDAIVRAIDLLSHGPDTTARDGARAVATPGGERTSSGP